MIRKRLLSFALSVLLIALLFMSDSGSNTSVAAESQDSMVVVSLGDSYSSGEGIEPFYSQELPLSKKMFKSDWLAHRSRKSWPSLLKVPGYEGTMARYHTYENNGAECQWFFAASSGAVSSDVYMTNQNKTVDKKEKVDGKKVHRYASTNLAVQTDIFDKVQGDADYVTMSIGGNDVGFAKIMEVAAIRSTYLGSHKLEKRIKELEDNMSSTLDDLKASYEAVEEAAGDDANIIIAGYPHLLDPNGGGAPISLEEAQRINTATSFFNNGIQKRVEECRNDGMNIHFVSVENVFAGHEAYSAEPWIRGITTKQSQDLTDGIVSAYSMHPNEDGAKAYAQEVNRKIAEIENSKQTGTISGKVCLASDNSVPVKDAGVVITNTITGLVRRTWSDASGNYTINLPAGTYTVEVGAAGYIKAIDETTVTLGETTYLETALLIAGSEDETGIATGNITNAYTGEGLADATITVRRGWNNFSRGGIVRKTTTDSRGNYSIDVALGNYCMTVSKQGFITGAVNIIVQRGTTANQNGSITPIVTEGDYRIVLTWGENPRDLDSHMVGRLSDGSSFHVYYIHKKQFDEGTEICNLDVDDTTSYGPETVTVKVKESSPYYYYIHRYAGSGHISTSSAQIKVYKGESLIKTFNVPTDLGNGDYWNVFAIVNGQIVVKNTMTNVPDTSYAGANIDSDSDIISTNMLMGRSDKVRDINEELGLLMDADLEAELVKEEEDESVVTDEEDVELVDDNEETSSSGTSVDISEITNE